MRAPQSPENEAQRIAALRTFGDLESLADDALDALVRVAAAVCDVPIAVVSLVDERRQRFVAKVGLAVDETARSISFCGHAILDTDHTLVVPDAREDERFADNPLVANDPSIRFYAGAPLVVDGDLALGTLCVIDRAPRTLSSAQLAALRDLSLAVTRLLASRRMTRQLVTTFDREVATREQLAVVLDKTPSMLAYWNHDFTARFANTAYEKFFHPEGPVRGLHIRDVIGERLWNQNRPLLEAAFRGESQRFERIRPDAQGHPQVAIGEYTPDVQNGEVCGVVVSLVDVTESRAAAAELARRNELLTMAEDVADVGHWRLDIASQTVFWSPQVYRIMGVDPAGFSPTRATAIERYHPDDRERVSTLVARSIERGLPFEFELRILRRSGELRFVHSRGRCETNARGEAIAVFGVIQDVTSRKRAEEAIVGLQQRVARQSAIYETMLRHMPRGAVLLVDRDLRYISVQGPSVSDVLAPGVDPATIVGRRIDEIVPEVDRATVMASYRATLEGQSLQIEAPRGDHVFEARTAPIYDGGDEPVAALAYLYDITERKAQERALALERERFRALVTHAPVAIWEIDLEGNITARNGRWAELTGLSGESTTTREGWFGPVHPDDRARLLREITPDEAHLAAPYFATSEYRVVTPSGELKWLVTITTPMRTEGGAPMGLIATTLDVTPQKASAATLERSVREKETLLKEIHHRVKNNLQVVGSILSLHANRAADPSVRTVLAEVKGRVHAIALLHERIYRSSDLANIDLLEYVRGLTTDVARVAGVARGAARVTGSPVPVDMDVAVPVGLIVNELVTNAFKHGTRPGGPPATVEVEIAEANGSVRVRVSDDGPGLPPDYRADASRSLGMFLVASLSEQLGGTFRISREGEQTRAVLTFPCGGDA